MPNDADKSCALYIRFYDADSFTDTDLSARMYRKAITLIVGSKIHVDILIWNPESPGMIQLYYTAFEGESFGMHLAQTNPDTSKYIIRIPVSPLECMTCINTIWALEKKKIPYNYQDTRFSMPFYSPYSLLLDDVSSETITTAYCSQIIIILLRESLLPDNDPCEKLYQLNSRVTSPNTLWNVLVEHFESTTSDELIPLMTEASQDSRKFVHWR
jgi:hypothetical protein